MLLSQVSPMFANSDLLLDVIFRGVRTSKHVTVQSPELVTHWHSDILDIFDANCDPLHYILYCTIPAWTCTRLGAGHTEYYFWQVDCPLCLLQTVTFRFQDSRPADSGSLAATLSVAQTTKDTSKWIVSVCTIVLKSRSWSATALISCWGTKPLRLLVRTVLENLLLGNALLLGTCSEWIEEELREAEGRT